MAALACGRPLAIPGELWPAWQGGLDRGEPVQSAAIAPVWFGGRMQGAVSVVHRGEDRAAGRVTALAPVGEFAELAGRVLSHTAQRQLSAADPRPEIDSLLATVARRSPRRRRAATRSPPSHAGSADELGLCGPALIELDLAARLHDVGRLRMPARSSGDR